MVLAATIAIATPIELEKALEKQLPIIYGDFLHDDWEGLQAAMNGQEFVCDSGVAMVKDGICYIHQGFFKVSKTLHLTGNSQVVMTNTYVETSGDPMILVHPEAENNILNGLFFERPPGTPQTGVGIEIMPRGPTKLENLTFESIYNHEEYI